MSSPTSPSLFPSASLPAPLTVSQVSALIRQVLAEGLPAPVRVVGEISNFSIRTHWFFSLKDESATLRCVCFASVARRIRFQPRDGMQVVATGRIDYFPTQGHLQLYVDQLEPVGIGALELQLRALMEELRKLGYFDEARKKPLPLLPRRIAIVTSRTGAALQDVINTVRRRWAGCRLYLLDVHVQGAEAAPEIAAAIRALSRDGRRFGIDAIILTRGGGSIEDLWAFNERIVADAIFDCSLPIVAAIGHETDLTIAELVADRRASTPTQAAMLLVPDRSALEDQLNQSASRLYLLVHRHFLQARQHLETLTRRLHPSVHHHFLQARQHLDALTRHPFFRQPLSALVPLRQRLDQLQRTWQQLLPRRLEQARQRLDTPAHRLHPLIHHRLLQTRQHLDALARHLQAVNPTRILERGYSYTLGPDGKLLRSVRRVHPGLRVTTILHDGRFHSRVEATAPNPSSTDPPASSAQPGLFP